MYTKPSYTHINNALLLLIQMQNICIFINYSLKDQQRKNIHEYNIKKDDILKKWSYCSLSIVYPSNPRIQFSSLPSTYWTPSRLSKYGRFSEPWGTRAGAGSPREGGAGGSRMSTCGHRLSWAVWEESLTCPEEEDTASGLGRWRAEGRLRWTLSGFDGGTGRGVSGRGDTGAEVRSVLGMHGRQDISNAGARGVRWGRMRKRWYAGRKACKGQKQGKGGGTQGLEGLVPLAKEFGLMGLVFVFCFSPMAWTIFCKPRQSGEHYRAHVFRFYVHAYVYFCSLYFFGAVLGS